MARNRATTLFLLPAAMVVIFSVAPLRALAQQPPQPRPEFPGAMIMNPKPPFLVGVAVNHADARYREGDELSMLVQAEQDAHLYLIYHQADGSSKLLLPNAVNRQSRLVAKTPAVVPSPTGAGYRFVTQPPYGQEVVQVIASRVPLELLEKLPTPDSRATVIEPQVFSALQDQLFKDLGNWSEHRVQLLTEAALPAAPHKRARIGLFIGIGQYQDPKICATHEELGHSAEVMRDVMQRHGQLDRERTKLVMNEQATRAQMEELFTKWLPSVSEPGDFVFIYYSGHAGRFDTADPAEVDGQNESIAPYDLSAGNESLPVVERLKLLQDSNILDDTLGMWLQELAGRQVVFVFDTCHAGGLVQEKAVPLKLSPILGEEVKRIKDISGMNLVVMTACASDEQAQFEGTSNKTMWFTMCLCDAIENSSERPLSAQAAFAMAEVRMKQVLREANAGRAQQPQLFDSSLLPVVLAP